MPIKHQKAVLETIKKLHKESGWNAVYGYLKQAKIRHKLTEKEFGIAKKSVYEANIEFK